jgi:(2Fe-2S) ferredoxin
MKLIIIFFLHILYIQLFNEDHSVNGRRGHCKGNKKLDDRGARRLKILARRNPFMTSEQLKAEHLESGSTPVTSRTIRRYLGRLHLKSFMARRKPFVSAFQRIRRVRWARALSKKTVHFWRQTLFSDECQICLFHGGKRQRVFRGPKEAFFPQHLRPTVKHGISAMVWGCISYKGVGKIRILEPGIRMNSAWYCSILENEVTETLQEHYHGSNTAKFQDDGAPCHRAKVVIRKCKELGIRQIPWPGQSPDCNVIENVWSVLKSKVREHNPKTLNQLKATIHQVWYNEITPEYCKRLINSMPTRLKSVIRVHGYPTKY